jgi:prevent-host-death family protein
MVVITVTASEVEQRISAVLDQVKASGEPLFIVREGRAEAVVLGVEQYIAMMDLLEDLEDERDAELGRAIAEARAAYRAGRGRDFADFVVDLEDKT